MEEEDVELAVELTSFQGWVVSLTQDVGVHVKVELHYELDQLDHL